MHSTAQAHVQPISNIRHGNHHQQWLATTHHDTPALAFDQFFRTDPTTYPPPPPPHPTATTPTPTDPRLKHPAPRRRRVKTRLGTLQELFFLLPLPVQTFVSCVSRRVVLVLFSCHRWDGDPTQRVAPSQSNRVQIQPRGLVVHLVLCVSSVLLVGLGQPVRVRAWCGAVHQTRHKRSAMFWTVWSTRNTEQRQWL